MTNLNSRAQLIDHPDLQPDGPHTFVGRIEYPLDNNGRREPSTRRHHRRRFMATLVNAVVARHGYIPYSEAAARMVTHEMLDACTKHGLRPSHMAEAVAYARGLYFVRNDAELATQILMDQLPPGLLRGGDIG
jgi:hypothetical protein